MDFISTQVSNEKADELLGRRVEGTDVDQCCLLNFPFQSYVTGEQRVAGWRGNSMTYYPQRTTVLPQSAGRK